MKRLAFLLVALPLAAHAGGSNYGIALGLALASIAVMVAEREE